jgi:hypothetical protein
MSPLDLLLRSQSVNSMEFAKLRHSHPWQSVLAQSLGPLHLLRQSLLRHFLVHELAKQ